MSQTYHLVESHTPSTKKRSYEGSEAVKIDKTNFVAKRLFHIEMFAVTYLAALPGGIQSEQ